jgi:hypothetical protein
VTQFRKIPAVVEAMQYTGDNREALFQFAGVRHDKAVWESADRSRLFCSTANGDVVIHVGDWICAQRLPSGRTDYWPVAPDIFAQTYESAAPAPAGAPESQTKEQWAAGDMVAGGGASDITDDDVATFIRMIGWDDDQRDAVKIALRYFVGSRRISPPPAPDVTDAEETQAVYDYAEQRDCTLATALRHILQEFVRRRATPATRAPSSEETTDA